MKTPVYKLDPNHERYRICKEPTCKKSYMTPHKGREFCCDKCKQEYNNRKTRNIAVELKKELEVAASIQSKWQMANKRDLMMLDLLQLPLDGAIFPKDDIEAGGFDFNAYNERIMVDCETPSFNLRYGAFLMRLIDDNNIFIIKLTNHESKF